MTSLPITESVIRQHATAESYRRGQEYEELGAVLDVERRGNLLLAEVMGSAPEPYLIEIAFDAAGITSASCSCPVEWGWCKHIVATLLVCLHQPDQVEDSPPRETSIADLGRDQLQGILTSLAARDPAIARAIDSEVARLQTAGGSAPTTSAAARPRPIAVDTKALRREVRGAIRGLDRLSGSEAYWMVGSVVGDVGALVERAWTFTRAGDGRTALAMLEAITDEYVDDWTDLDDSDGEAGGLFATIGEAWTEALLTADLSPDERQDWAERLEEWDAEVSQYGVDDAFTAAIDAAEVGWDEPELQRILAGEPVADGDLRSWSEEADGGMTVARLNVLERQGRDEEYLRLARAEGLSFHYAAALVRLGRLDDAASYGLTHFSLPGQALALAERLREREALELAVAVAEAGLSYGGSKLTLALWLGELAAGLGKRDLALRAAETAFAEDQSLAPFQRVQELSGDGWPDRRKTMLEQLRTSQSIHRQGRVEIFLHERLIDDAIAAVDGTNDYYAIEPVVKAAVATHPDWAIRSSKDQAEPIMDQGQSQHYHHAVRWLGHARDAYLAAGRRSEWQAYLAGLLAQHGRKYKLVGMLKALGR